MPGIFVDEFLVAQWSASMQVNPGYSPALLSRHSAPYKSSDTPGPGTVFADLDVDTDLALTIDVDDWNVALDSGDHKSIATLLHQVSFSAGLAGETYYGMCLYWIDDDVGDMHLQYAEAFPTPYIVPVAGGDLPWQYTLELKGACS